MDVSDLLLAGDWSSSTFYQATDSAGASDVAAVLALATHDDPAVRGSVALTLPLLTHGGAPTGEMVEAAAALSTDPDKRVRDYACFALAEQWREVDSPVVRDALAARLDDIDRETRCEALVGLAYRRDPRALPRVRAALSRPNGDVWRQEMVAAGALSDPQLHDLVLRHQVGWEDLDAAGTADAVCRLTDPDGPGDDVLDGVAELYRRRAHGRPDGVALEAVHLLMDMLDIAPHRAGESFQEVLARVAGDDAAECEIRTRSALAQLVEEASSASRAQSPPA